MIQDISPRLYNVTYQKRNPANESLILSFDGQSILAMVSETEIKYPTFLHCGTYDADQFTFLFKMDDQEYFLYRGEKPLDIKGYTYESTNIFRKPLHPKHHMFAGMSATHINKWYKLNRFCGSCGSRLRHSNVERMLECDGCGNNVYPKISPAVIVGLYDGDRLLMTKYAGRQTANYALIAGFIEIGESPEDTAHREVMEEAGVKIKNLTYYKSQPWGYSDSLLIGFFAELDGDSTIVLDTNELSEASWIKRDEIEVELNDFSLTNEMIWMFKENRI